MWRVVLPQSLSRLCARHADVGIKPSIGAQVNLLAGNHSDVHTDTARTHAGTLKKAHKLSVCLFVCLSLYLSLCLCLSVSVPLSVSLCLSVSVPLSVSLCL